jgi:hypothetical protein
MTQSLKAPWYRREVGKGSGSHKLDPTIGDCQIFDRRLALAWLHQRPARLVCAGRKPIYLLGWSLFFLEMFESRHNHNMSHMHHLKCWGLVTGGGG